MALLKNTETDQSITRFISLEQKQEAVHVIQKTLDGTHYIQRIGDPAVTYNVTAFVTEQGKALLESAADLGTLLCAQVSNGEYFGRIIKLQEFERLATGLYKATLTLAKESEV